MSLETSSIASRESSPSIVTTISVPLMAARERTPSMLFPSISKLSFLMIILELNLLVRATRTAAARAWSPRRFFTVKFLTSASPDNSILLPRPERGNVKAGIDAQVLGVGNAQAVARGLEPEPGGKIKIGR